MSTTEVDLGLLRIPSVRRFLASSALSRTGISLMLPVLFEQAYDITGVPLTIGIIGLLQFVPAVLVFLSGHLADRFDRRRVTALMTVGRAGCAVAFFVYSRGVGDMSDAAVWPLYAITLAFVAFVAFGAFDAIAMPARSRPGFCTRSAPTPPTSAPSRCMRRRDDDRRGIADRARPMTVGRRHCCAGRRAEPSRPALDTPVSYWLPPAASPTIISGATLV